MRLSLHMKPLRRIAFTLLLTVLTVTAWADNVKYIDADGNEQTVDATAVTSETLEMGTAETTSWYYVENKVENYNRIELQGTVNLILCENCDFNANYGMHLPAGNTLNIYTQSDGNGDLNADCYGNDAAIGGNGGDNHEGADGEDGENAGDVNIYGGRLYISGPLGGGRGGDGIEDGAGGGASILLSWTHSSDYVYASSYYGTVTLKKAFTDGDSNSYAAGTADVNDIYDKYLYSTDYVIYHEQAVATCTEVGYLKDCWYKPAIKKYYTDSECTQEIAKDEVVIPALGHKMTNKGKDATFTTPGKVGYWYCENCKKYFKDAKGEIEWEDFNPDDDLTFKVEGNATDGYSIRMPKNGTGTLCIDNNVTFKIYDDGGEGGSTEEGDQPGNYSNDCDGYLVLKAPESYLIQLTGNIMTEYDCDYLTVYKGTTTDGTVLLEQKWSENSGQATNIGTLTASNMMLYFHSDEGVNYAGLDLTVTVFENKPYSITIPEATEGGSVKGSATTASVGDEVTLTATPADGYWLNSITVKTTTGEEVPVTGGTWDNNIATFIMPIADVTVTPSFSDKITNASVKMPKTGTTTIEIPTAMTTLKIYDDGGEGGSEVEGDQPGNYSNDCDGYLVLKAPEGYLIQLTGNIMTEYDCDYLTVYKGTTTKGIKLLNKKWSENSEQATSIGTLTASSMMLYFYSDETCNYAGLDLTATVLEDKLYTITIPEEIEGGEVVIKGSAATANVGDEVTLTATPADGYWLNSITVKTTTGEEVPVTGGTWDNNIATFIMPGADVTVTPSFTNNITNASVKMPKTGTTTIEIPAAMSTLKIYDDGGKGGSTVEGNQPGNYSDKCDGYLVLKAPEGYAIQLTGNIITEKGYDYLTVYGSTTNEGTILLDQKWSDVVYEEQLDCDIPVPTSIGTLVASNMTLYFYSDGSTNYAGLDLTAKLIQTTPHTITIQQAAGGEVTGPASAGYGDEVTLTATPKDDNKLKSITVKITSTGEEVAVSGGSWYNNNTATFIMPDDDVTVTPVFSDDIDYSIMMPREGKTTATIPTDIPSIKIYDDGGEGGNYSNDCSGSLVLKAPKGYAIQLTGNIKTEAGDEDDAPDYLTVHAGTTGYGYMLLNTASGEVTINDENCLIASSMTLFFHSNESKNDDGLNLTATLVPITGVMIGYDEDGRYATFDENLNEEIKIEEDIRVHIASIERDYVDGVCLTLMVPFDFVVGKDPLTDIDDENTEIRSRFYTFTGVTYNDESGKWEAVMTEVKKGNKILANTPMLVMPDNGLSFFNEDGLTLNTTGGGNKQTTSDDWTFIGIYTEKTWTAGEVGNDYGFAATDGTSADGETNVEAGDFVKVGVGAHSKTLRCYLTYTGKDNPWATSRSSEVGDLPQSISVVLVNTDGSTTKIGAITPSYTNEEGVWYSLSGLQLNGKPTKKGLYIHNGKKVVVK